MIEPVGHSAERVTGVTPGTADTVDRFGLLASSVAGRPVLVAAADSGQRTWTDGTTIFVDQSLVPIWQMRSICIQACLLACDSLAPAIVNGLGRRPRRAWRYLAVECHRALQTCEVDLPRTVLSVLDRSLATLARSPQESLALARGRAPLPQSAEVFGTIHPRRIRGDSVWGSDASNSRHVPRPGKQQLLREFDEEEQRGGPDVLSSPVGGGGALGRMFKRLLADRLGSGSGEPGADTPTHVVRTARGGGFTPTISSAGLVIDDGDSLRSEGWHYDEWDVRQRRYRQQWCTVREIEIVAEVVARRTWNMVPNLRRPLSHVALGIERCGRQLDGTDLDIDAAVEHLASVQAGQMHDGGLYVDLVRNRRDLGVLILLDVSGSSGQASPAGGSVHDHQCTTALALVDSLHALGDRVALSAFRSVGRSAVHILPLKRFNDAPGITTRARLAQCAPSAYTRLGAAIRHSAWRLERDSGMQRRLLVVISDGFAYDHGYEGSYGEADARKALAETRRLGIGCLCLSVGAPVEPAALRRIFGTVAHASVARPEHLAEVIGPVFRSALRSAELHRQQHVRFSRVGELNALESRPA